MAPSVARIGIPVVDLRREPIAADLSYALSDHLQESQLLYGEEVEVLDQVNGWSRVQAVEQSKWVGDRWIGYPGWVPTCAIVRDPSESPATSRLIVVAPWAEIRAPDHTFQVSLGTILKGISKQDGRWHVRLVNGHDGSVEARDVLVVPLELSAKSVRAFGDCYEGHPYLWGGRSAYRQPYGDVKTGMDCSALSQLLYRLAGAEIPRDAHDQMRKSRIIPAQDLSVGDLVFLPDTKIPDRVGHVMVYAGDEHLFETSRSVGKAQWVTFTDKIGVSLAQLRRGISHPVLFGCYR